MPTKHKVKQGECISSIAERYGLFPETIWEDPANAELREKRKDLNVLYPDDVVVIPDKKMKEEPGATELRHRFRKKGVPSYLDIVVKKHGEARGKESFILNVDGATQVGETKDDGSIRCPIPPNAKKAILIVGEGEDEITYEIQLGNLDPDDEKSGVSERLNNLGFRCGKIKEGQDEATEDALMAFQKEKGLKVTGKPDEDTRKALKQDHNA